MKHWNNDDCPCSRDCPRRAAGCHATCKEYTEWKEKHEAERAALSDVKRGEYAARATEIKRVDRVLTAAKKARKYGRINLKR